MTLTVLLHTVQPAPWHGFFRIDDFYNVFMWRYDVVGTYTIASLWTGGNLTMETPPNQYQIMVVPGRVNVAKSTFEWAPSVADTSNLPAGQPFELQLAAVDSYGTVLSPPRQ